MRKTDKVRQNIIAAVAAKNGLQPAESSFISLCFCFLIFVKMMKCELLKAVPDQVKTGR